MDVDLNFKPSKPDSNSTIYQHDDPVTPPTDNNSPPSIPNDPSPKSD